MMSGKRPRFRSTEVLNGFGAEPEGREHTNSTDTEDGVNVAALRIDRTLDSSCCGSRITLFAKHSSSMPTVD